MISNTNNIDNLDAANKEIDRLKKVCSSHWNMAQDQITLVQAKNKKIAELIQVIEDYDYRCRDCLMCD